MDYRPFSSDDEKTWSLPQPWKVRMMSLFDGCKLILILTLIVLSALSYVALELSSTP
jgi:hypothetical protein